jgi:hypothetical protein
LATLQHANALENRFFNRKWKKYKRPLALTAVATVEKVDLCTELWIMHIATISAPFCEVRFHRLRVCLERHADRSGEAAVRPLDP